MKVREFQHNYKVVEKKNIKVIAIIQNIKKKTIIFMFA